MFFKCRVEPAGPQLGKSVVVGENKKSFYKKKLFEPFPVEPCLLKVLPNYLNAEISNGTG